MVGRKPVTAKHLHFKSKPTRRFPRRTAGFTALAIVILAGAAATRAATESIPRVVVHRVGPASLVIPGAAPSMAWPSQGEAALTVKGLPPLGSFGLNTPVPIASLAKIMTAYVLLQDHPLPTGQNGFTVTVSSADVSAYQTASSQQQSVVAVAQGETLTESQLLQALLVASGNNIATTIANYDASSTEAFVAKMNSTARNLGMNHTSYTDPSGLASTTVSTASDQLLLAGRAMAIPAFAQVVAMPSVTLPVAGTIANFNKAVGTGGYVGVKTGSTTTAGGCLVFANRQTIGETQFTILGVVLGQDIGQTSTSVLTTAALNAANALVGSVTASISNRTVLPAGTVVAEVTNASGRKVPARTTGPLTTIGFGGLTVPLVLSERPLGSQLSAGQAVATATVGGEAVPVAVSANVPSATWSWRLSHIF